MLVANAENTVHNIPVMHGSIQDSGIPQVEQQYKQNSGPQPIHPLFQVSRP